ncbi:MAG: hypothetical protein N2316_10170 [Spirochaetes bacterium]|nr:hypothetical protein [Spirochaetota bacterium]
MKRCGIEIIILLLMFIACGDDGNDSGVRDIKNNGDGTSNVVVKKIVFMGIQSGSTKGDIYVMNEDGTNVTNLTNTSDKAEYYPLWSPDGTKIVFSSERDGNFNIYLWSTSNTVPQRLTDSTAKDAQHCWSPDGTKIVFVSERDVAGRGQIYVMNADGSNQTRLTTDDDLNCMVPQWQL